MNFRNYTMPIAQVHTDCFADDTAMVYSDNSYKSLLDSSKEVEEIARIGSIYEQPSSRPKNCKTFWFLFKQEIKLVISHFSTK